MNAAAATGISLTPTGTPRTLCDLFYRSVEAYRKAELLRFKRDGRWQALSSQELLRLVEETALGLASIGVRRGERLALFSENRPEWAIADLAALCCGAVVTPIYPTLPTAQVESLLADSEAAWLVAAGPKLATLAPSLRDRLPGLRGIVVFDDVSSHDAVPWKQVRERGALAVDHEPGRARCAAYTVRPEDPATLVYTAGTTGQPKGVLLTHANIVSNVLACHQVFPCLGTRDVALSVLPLSHVFERTTGQFLMLHAGATIAYAEGQEQIAANLRELRPTVLSAVPRLFEKARDRCCQALGAAIPPRRMLAAWALAVGRTRFRERAKGATPSLALRLKHWAARRLVLDRIRERVGGGLRIIVSGGAPLATEVAEFFGAIGLPIREGYGLTETGPVIAVNPRERIKPGSVGRPVAGVEVRLIEDGEILVRGPSVMLGYHNRPEETAQALDAQGWFHTGDIGALDADGYLFVTGAKKDFIVTSGGKKIAPLRIEQMLRSDPLISDVVVVGTGRRFACALVVPDFVALERWASENGIAFASPRELVRHPEVLALYERRVAERTPGLAPFETIKRTALLSDAFSIEAGEVTPKLSLRRKMIEEHYRAVIEALYT